MTEEEHTAAHAVITRKWQQAREAIRDEFPQLLRDYRDHFVVYDGPKRVAVAKTQEELHQRLVERGPLARETYFTRITDTTVDDIFCEELIA